MDPIVYILAGHFLCGFIFGVAGNLWLGICWKRDIWKLTSFGYVLPIILVLLMGQKFLYDAMTRDFDL